MLKLVFCEHKSWIKSAGRTVVHFWEHRYLLLKPRAWQKTEILNSRDHKDNSTATFSNLSGNRLHTVNRSSFTELDSLEVLNLDGNPLSRKVVKWNRYVVG
uniref:Uncharacterized protein n=1 Tax=Parascaris equorum TaxID=6256 RepID=A0A914R7Y0_PAREQ